MEVSSLDVSLIRQVFLAFRHHIGGIIDLLLPSHEVLLEEDAARFILLALEKALLTYFWYETTRLDLQIVLLVVLQLLLFAALRRVLH